MGDRVDNNPVGACQSALVVGRIGSIVGPIVVDAVLALQWRCRKFPC